MADGDTPGGATGDTPNSRETPAGEPAAPPPQAYPAAYPPYSPYSPYPEYPAYPPSMPPGAPGAAGAQQPDAAQGQPSPNPPYAYPPYPYPSAAYAPPAQYPYPYPYAAPQPARGSNRALWITLSAVGAVLLVVCVSCSVLFAVSLGRAANSLDRLAGPTFAAITFCTDIQEQDYAAAYTQFSQNLRSQMTQDAFESAARARDQASGPVTDCTPDTNTSADTSGPPTLVHVTVTRGSDSGSAFTYRGDLTFVQEGGSWKLDAIDSSLGLT
jgi:hypothetical protein